MIKKTVISFILVFAIILAGLAQIPASADLAKPMGVGSEIPEIWLQDVDGKAVNTKDIFSKPSILVVYRGGWCPYCNKQLSGLALIEKDILAMGYQVIAISPDAPAQLKATIDKSKLNYTLLSDQKAELIKAMGLAFTAPDRYKELLIKSSNGANAETVLPVPAVYVFDNQGKALYVYSNPDYKVRLDEQELLNKLKSLSK